MSGDRPTPCIRESVSNDRNRCTTDGHGCGHANLILRGRDRVLRAAWCQAAQALPWSAWLPAALAAASVMYSPCLVLPYHLVPAQWYTWVSVLTHTWPTPPPGAAA